MEFCDAFFTSFVRGQNEDSLEKVFLGADN